MRFKNFLRVETIAVAAFALALGAAVLRPLAPAAEPSRLATIDLEKT
jgi:hypothetical protein